MTEPAVLSAAITDDGSTLTRKETREIVTPYAFEVSPDLLGTVLATPLQRAIAITIDGLLILMLASASLLVVLPLMLYLCWLRWQLKKYRQVAALVVLTLLLSSSFNWMPQFWQDAEMLSTQAANNSSHKFDFISAAVLTKAALTFNDESCQQACIEEELADMSDQLQESGMASQDAESVFKELLLLTKLPQVEQQQLLQRLVQQYTAAAAQAKAEANIESSVSSDNAVAGKIPGAAEPAKKHWYKPSAGTQSVLGWVKGILADFGLGFGWAVFYFTLLTGWGHGQTIGKKFLKIKVIQLDGRELSFWDAFSRQGGYGAGFATGLIGFLQVFWDPNRQAIQDKVASTVVIKLNQPKRPLHH
jgi:uncharacterized RDD family membrane protein YckC